MTEKWPKTSINAINDFSHRIMKEMQFLMGERYPLYMNCHGIENLSYLFENQFLITLEGGETPMDGLLFGVNRVLTM